MVSAWAGIASAAPYTHLFANIPMKLIQYAGRPPCQRQQYHFPKASEESANWVPAVQPTMSAIGP